MDDFPINDDERVRRQHLGDLIQLQLRNEQRLGAQITEARVKEAASSAVIETLTVLRWLMQTYGIEEVQAVLEVPDATVRLLIAGIETRRKREAHERRTG